MENREEQRLQRRGAWRVPPHPSHVSTQAEEPQAWRLPAPAQKGDLPQALGCAFCDWGLDGGLLGCCERFWGTVPRAKERGKIAPKHQGLKLTLCFPPSLCFLICLVSFNSMNSSCSCFSRPCKGTFPVELLCFVGGCCEIVLCFVISLGVIVSSVFSCRLYGRVEGGKGEGKGPRALIVCFGRKKKQEKEQKNIYHSRK